jgi:hypothetical protein
MDAAALVISIFAVLLSLIVAGFAIGLQWRMFNATSQQLNLIGKENASLGERIAMSLGQLHETATSTKSRLDTTMGQLVSGLLERVAPWPQAVGAERRQIQRDPGGWRLQRAAAVLRGRPVARVVVGYLASSPRDWRDLGAQLFDLRPQADEQQDPGEAIRWGLEVVAAVLVLDALELLARDPEANTVTLAPEGTDLGRLLAEGAHD